MPGIKVKSNKLRPGRQSKAKTIKHLEDKIVSYKMGKELINHMNDALNYTQEKQSVLCNGIKSTLLDILKEEAARYGTNPEEILLSQDHTNKLVQFIAHSTKNNIHKVNGN